MTGNFDELKGIASDVESMRLEGQFLVQKPGFHQLVLRTQGKLSLQVDGEKVFDGQLSKQRGEVFVPLGLEQGWHDLIIELYPDKRPNLKVLLAGEQVAKFLTKSNLRHSLAAEVE